jgi:phosphosulfolactate phosphohydrolase-like enzyme
LNGFHFLGSPDTTSMTIETILTPAELPALAQRDLRATACVVFDVLRATSTFVTALHHGAEGIIPVGEIAEALAIKRNQPEVLLGGERNGIRISAEGIDFDLGNSSREYTAEKVSGRTIVSTTTNGTRALRACAHAQTVLAASFLNLAATAEFIRRQNCASLLLVCAGTGESTALEDVLAAGAMVDLVLNGPPAQNPMVGRAVPCPPPPVNEGIRTFADGVHGVTRPTLSDSAQVAMRTWLEAKRDLAGAVSSSENARRLLAIPELHDDVAFCLQRDFYTLVAQMGPDGAIRKVKIHSES